MYKYNSQDHREVAQNYERSYKNWYDEGIVQFRPNFHRNQEPNSVNDGYNSGEASPPLWGNSPSRPLLRRRSLSPESRTEAITKGRCELMEMVKNMPEASYELSLKDLVEHNRVESVPPPRAAEVRVPEGKNVVLQRRVKVVRRNESLENRGVVLNMVFPFSLRSKKKRNFDRNSSGKVSPPPEMGLKGGGGGGGGGERDWWKKKFTGSSDSDSSRVSGSTRGGSSGSSGSSGRGSTGSGRSHGGGRRRDGFEGGCCVFFKSRRGKSVE